METCYCPAGKIPASIQSSIYGHDENRRMMCEFRGRTVICSVLINILAFMMYTLFITETVTLQICCAYWWCWCWDVTHISHPVRCRLNIRPRTAVQTQHNPNLFCCKLHSQLSPHGDFSVITCSEMPNAKNAAGIEPTLNVRMIHCLATFLF